MTAHTGALRARGPTPVTMIERLRGYNNQIYGPRFWTLRGNSNRPWNRRPGPSWIDFTLFTSGRIWNHKQPIGPSLSSGQRRGEWFALLPNDFGSVLMSPASPLYRKIKGASADKNHKNRSECKWCHFQSNFPLHFYMFLFVHRQ